MVWIIGKAVPLKQKSICSSSITIKYLFAFFQPTRGSKNKVHIVIVLIFI